VHRHAHSARASIYAYPAELDAWLANRRVAAAAQPAQLAQPVPPPPPVPPRRPRRVPVIAGAAIGVALVAIAGLVVWRVSARQGARPPYTLAVLPFESLSADSNDALVADGLTDDIITALGRSGQIAVISRRSVGGFKGAHVPLPRVAAMLHANLILEGTITHAGKAVRITAQLVDAATDHHLWAESYERDSANVLTLQDQVSDEVSTTVLEKLTGRRPIAPRPVRLVDPDVRLAYLTGRFFWSKRDAPGLTRAVGYFRQAIHGDSTYGPAYAGLADSYNLLGTFGLMPEKEAFPAARVAALQAIRFDSTLAEAYNSLAFEAYRYDWDFATADRYFRYAIQLNPSYATAHQWYGEFLGDLHRSNESIVESRRAVELDPLSAIARSDMAESYMHADRYDQAVVELRRVFALYPDFALAHSYLAGNYYEMGHLDAMRAEQRRLAEIQGDSNSWAVLRIEDDWAGGRLGAARAGIEAMRRQADAAQGTYLGVAHDYAVIGDFQAALAMLERSYQHHEWMLVTMKVDPYLAGLRGDPRYLDLIRRIGIP
jgi:TolB-like protein/tetratricopeptide (TPR) repeat protein